MNETQASFPAWHHEKSRCLLKRIECAEALNSTKHEAEPANLEVIQSEINTFHITASYWLRCTAPRKCFITQEIVNKLYCNVSVTGCTGVTAF